jgi:hypothetical protein
MVRTRQRTTKRGGTSADIILIAVKEALEGHLNVRAVGRKYDTDHATLLRYCKKYTRRLRLQSTSTDEIDVQTCTDFLVGYSKLKQVFTQDEENLQEAYVKKAASLYYGLNPKEIRHLAYEFAVKNNKTVPRNWQVDERAGTDWFTSFMTRHTALSVREPETLCVARATSFNKTNVSFFFNNLSTVLERHNFGPENMFNIDETGITTVQRPS